MISAPGRCCEQILRQDHQDLIAPQHPPAAIDDANPIAITVESKTEVDVSLRDGIDQIAQVFRLRRIGMVVGKMAVDRRMKQHMAPRQVPDQQLDHRPGRAVPRVPADAQGRDMGRVYAAERLQDPRDIGVGQIGVLDSAGAAAPRAGGSDSAEIEYVIAKEWLAPKIHLEAIVILGVVAAGYLYAAVHLWR